MNNKTKSDSDLIKELDLPGREKFKLLCEKLGVEFGEPSNEKLAYDCYIIRNGKKYLVELKDRNPKLEERDEYFLEVYKYDCLRAWKKRLNAAGIYYFCWFGNTVYIFNLEDDYVTKNPQRICMNKETYKSRDVKIQKDVYLLDKTKAKKITLKSK